MGVALPVASCHALSGSPVCSKFFNNVLNHSLLDARGIMKNIHPFSCNNQGILKWAWSCNAPRDADRTSIMYLCIFELLQKEF